MSKKNKIIIVIAIAIILFEIVMMGQKEDNKTVSNGENVADDVYINPIANKKSNNTFEIYNTNIDASNGITKFKATIKNISGSKTQEQKIGIKLLNSKGEKIATVSVTVPSLENAQTTIISAEDWTEYKDIYDFEIE